MGSGNGWPVSSIMFEVENWATNTISSRKAPSLTHRDQKSFYILDDIMGNGR